MYDVRDKLWHEFLSSAFETIPLPQRLSYCIQIWLCFNRCDLVCSKTKSLSIYQEKTNKVSKLCARPPWRNERKSKKFDKAKNLYNLLSINFICFPFLWVWQLTRDEDIYEFGLQWFWNFHCRFREKLFHEKTKLRIDLSLLYDGNHTKWTKWKKNENDDLMNCGGKKRVFRCKRDGWRLYWKLLMDANVKIESRNRFYLF